MLRVAIDIGGTFTDVVAETPEGMRSVKVLTSADAPERAALDGVARLLAQLDKTHADISDIVHGTTLATNALIERRGAKTAFITTHGFRDVLAMRTEKRFDQYALNITLPAPLVPRPLRLGLRERVLADGAVLIAPDEREIETLAALLRAEQVEAIAIGFLHAYKNSTHENMVAARLRQLLGNDITICQSAEVAGEIREYDRFSTVCANAYVRPLMSRYLGHLQDKLREAGFSGALLMMLSDGALTTVEQAARFPVRLIEGGPAGGVALAAHVAREVGSDRTLSLDIGGTTAKICFIEKGTPKTSRRFEVARAWRDVKGSGLPVKIPTVELVEIGAGGGSIAAVDRLGRLQVGPQSAGSEPGPAAYGRGGTQATITDAHITIGTIAAEGFAGGMIALDPALASKAVARDIQTPLQLEDPASAAAGIIELADETMANAARVHGIELGLDVAGFDLLVSGGGGAVHATRIAEKLGIRRVIVPQDAGVGSAVGFLRSPVAFETVVSVVEPLSEVDATALVDRLRRVMAEVTTVVETVVPAQNITHRLTAELRYKGQGYELSLPLDAASADAIAGLAARFEEEYEQQIGFTLKDIAIELISLSVTAREKRLRTAARPLEVQPCQAKAQPHIRAIFERSAANPLPFKVIPRESLNGQAMSGPAIISEAQTTTVVRPGWHARRGDQGHLVLERSR